MSKESSIKVYAENFSGSDKPVNAIPVWIENASAISGGGGGGSIPSDVSGKWENASNCVQSNSASWSTSTIPTNLSANNISARYSLNVGNVDKNEWGDFNGDGLLVDKSHLYIHPTDVRAGDQGVISLTSISGNWNSRVTATGDINAFDWNKLNDASNCVQSNSGSWGGGGSDTPELLDVVFHYNFGSYNNGEIINNTQSAINVKFNLQTNYQPSDLYIDGSPYTWNQDPDNPNYYIITTQIFPGNRLNGIPLYYSNNNTNYDSIIINNTYSGKFGYRTLTLYGKNAYFSGDNAYPYNITKHMQGSMQPLTSFNGNFSYSAMTNDAIFIEVFGQEDEGIPYNTYGSFISAPEPTVTSGDVFPPTTGLQSNTTYYLAWNDNNGGLFWYQPGN